MSERVRVESIGDMVHDISTLGARVRYARKKSGISVPELAARVDMAVGTFYELERGEIASTSKLHLIAKETGFSPAWLETGEGPQRGIEITEPMPEGWYIQRWGPGLGRQKYQHDHARWVMAIEQESGVSQAKKNEEPEVVFVGKIQDLHLRAGDGAGEPQIIIDSETVDTSRGFERAWMVKQGLRPDKCKLFDVKGDSMHPTLNDGDMVLINMADRVIRNGDIYAIVTEDGLRVKRIMKKTGGNIELRSDNQLQHRFPPEEMDPRQVAILGHVFWKAGRVM